MYNNSLEYIFFGQVEFTIKSQLKYSKDIKLELKKREDDPCLQTAF